ncbi:MAG TPA: hypothetical protein VFF30_07305 [Nitrososphaerales archaeon]|nr:hypothetical protein [Nitrososphaerales archaeon]
MAFTVESTITGIHSRSEETVRISRDFDRGRSTEKSLSQSFAKDAADLVRLEKRSGISQISDGQLKWQDYIRPIAESVEGLAMGADLFRWFDTNSFYRRPTVTGELRPGKKQFPFRKYVVLSALDSVPACSRSRRRKISLLGPYTLASLVEDRHYNSKVELALAFGKVLRKVIGDLSKLGFGTIQINEPSLVYRYGVSALTNRQELEVFVSSFEQNLADTPVELLLHTYFGDCSKILEDLVRMKGISSVGVDFTQTSLSDIESVELDGKSLACGCVDGRNSLIESPEWIARFCREAIKTLKPSGIVVLPSCELKYLPRKYADEKVASIGKATLLLKKEFTK